MSGLSTHALPPHRCCYNSSLLIGLHIRWHTWVLRGQKAEVYREKKQEEMQWEERADQASVTLQ